MKPLSITAKRMLRRAVAAFCACACVFAVSACGADETGKIRIGIKFDQPGLGFKKNGTYVVLFKVKNHTIYFTREFKKFSLHGLLKSMNSSDTICYLNYSTNF